MKMNIDRSLDLPLAAPEAWKLLANIEGVAGCMPGAKITERVDDSHYKGVVAVKLGPASMAFKGELEILEMDPVGRRIRVSGKAADAASSAATLELAAELSETGPDSSRIAGTSEITINGKAASFGSRLMTSVSDQLVGQFYGNLLKQAESLRAAQLEAAAAPAEGAQTAAAPAETVETVAARAAAEAPKLNVLALLWAALRDWVLSLFSRFLRRRAM